MTNPEPTLAQLADRLKRYERRNQILISVAALSALCAWLPTVIALSGFRLPHDASSINLHGGFDSGGLLRFQHECTAGIKDDYGKLVIWRMSRDKESRTQISLDDQGVTIERSKDDGSGRVRWTLTEEGPKFESSGK